MTQSVALQVRPATTTDIDLLVEYNQSMAVETEDRTLDTERVRLGVQAVFEDPARGTYFVAEEDGRVLGGLLVTREWSDWRNGWFWWIQSVYTSLEARRRGVYRALYAYVLGRARVAEQVCGIRLYVERENEVAMATYESLGMSANSYRFYEVDFVLGEA